MTLTLKDRIALVTGASRGIGYAACLELARRGAHVIALARTQGGLEELDDAIRALGGSATLMPCNVTDYDALDRLGAAIHERWGKLDIFIGNAGTHGVISPLGHIDPKEWEKAFAINVTANWRLIRSLDPLLRTSDAGRVVLVSSGAAHRADLRPYWGLYAATKSAVDTIARTYAAETMNVSPIRVMATNPGPLRTHMRAAVMPGEDPDTLRTPADFAPKLIDLCEPSWTHTGKLYDFPQNKVLSFRPPE